MSAAAGRALRCALAFALLNTLLTFGNRLPGLGVQWQPRLSIELALALALLAAWSWRRGPLSARAAGGFAGALVLLALVRYVDVTVPAVFGRPVNLYWDGRHAFDVLRLAFEGLSAPQRALLLPALAAAALALWALQRAARWAIATLSQACAAPAGRAERRAAGALAALLAVLFVAWRPDGPDTRYYIARPVSPMLAQQALFLASALGPEPGEAALGASPDFERHQLGGLNGADVLLLFAESYGASTLDNPALSAPLAGARERLAQAIAAGGRGVVSARARSPTFGGGSWLAHAELLSGLDTQDPGHYERLLASRRPTLVTHFARHGWRTVGWMPGLQKPWPEGSFYGYDRLAGADAIGYAGPAFGFWRIPDQVALAQLDRQELAHRDGPPRFVVFPTLATHAPFRPLPPYLADWSHLADPAAYSAEQQAAALAAPVSWRDAGAYVDALRYQFDWLAGYLQGRAPRKLVLIVLGDHQPLAAVTGAAASWDVPVHVIADDEALLRRFEQRGFVRGLQPGAAALGPLHQLTRVLIEAFDGAG